MKIVKLSAALVTGALLMAAASSPVFAASPTTDAFLSNLAPNVDFLDRSSRMALDHSKSARVKTYAHATAKEQTMAANAMDAWIEKGPSATVVASADDVVQTGRSVAVDGQRPAPAVDARLPMGQEDLDFIDGLAGKDFDASFKTKQLDALTQVQQDYQDYIAKGDDPALQKIASQELPKINRRIAELRRL